MSSLVRFARAQVGWGFDAFFDLSLELSICEQSSQVMAQLAGITATPGSIRFKHKDEVTADYLGSIALQVAERIRERWPGRRATVEVVQQYTHWTYARVEVMA